MDHIFTLSPKQTLAWLALEDNTTNEVFFGGGAGGGKSVLGILWHIHRRTKYAGSYGLIARNRYSDLQSTTMMRFWQIMQAMKYRPNIDYKYNDQKHIIKWKNGSYTFLKDLFANPSDPEFDSLGSSEYTDIFIDEAPEITEKAFEVIKSRCRYMLDEFGLEQKILTTGNPGPHWLRYRYVFDKEENRVQLEPHQKVILSTLEDNPNKGFRDKYRAVLEQMKDEYTKRRLLLGDWLAAPKTGREFIHSFSYDQSVRDNMQFYDAGSPLHITLDFNVTPYMTMLVAQIKWVPEENMWEVNYLKEYCLEHPFNSTKGLADAFLRDLTVGCFAGYNKTIFYYGDYNGLKRNTLGKADARHDYQVLTNILTRYISNNSKRVKTNPRVKKARSFLCEIFAGNKLIPIRVFVDRKMYTTIKDLQSLKEGPDGDMLKQYDTFPGTKERFEKYGHCVQALYYLPISAFEQIFKTFEKNYGSAPE